MQARLKGRGSAITGIDVFSLDAIHRHRIFSFFAILILEYSSRGMLFDDSQERNTSDQFPSSIIEGYNTLSLAGCCKVVTPI